MSGTTTPEDQFAQLQRYVEMIQGRQQAYAPPAPVDRSIVSLLGEAVGGGTTGLSPAEREDAGRRALLNFGANLSAASGYSTMPRTFGQVFAQGVGGAQQSLAGSEAVGAARLGAQQAYEEKQQELQLEKIKAAIPWLTLQTQMQQAAAARDIASGKKPGTSIATAGAPPADVPPGNYGAGGPAADAKVPAEWMPYYQEASARTGIPVDVLIAQARQESGFNAGATGKAGEIGVHQIKPSTAAEPGFGVKPLDPALLKDPRANINFAADYLKAHLPPGTDPTDPAAIRLALKGYNGGGDPNYVANVTRYLPAPAPPAGASTAAPYKVASAGTTAPPGSTTAPVPGSVAAETAGLVVPPGATMPPAAPGVAPTSAAPPPAPQYPDVTSGDVTVRHPGSFVDFAAREMAPVPQTEDFNPNLSRQKQAEFAARAKGLADQQRLLDSGAIPFADQPKMAADLLAARAALEAERSKEADAKAQAAATNTTKFQDTQREAVQKRYDAAVSAYTEAAKSKFGFHQDVVKSQATDQIATNTKMMEPYSISATQAAGLIPTIALARQILPELPQNAAPWLADENNRAKLESLAPFLPANWVKATDGASLYSQIMSNIIGTMGSNVQSGQTGGRESAYQQFKAEYPGLANTPEGRERGLLYAQELLERRMKLDEAMQVYRANAPRDPVTGIPDMSAARSTVENKVPMLQLPPVSYRPDLQPTDPKERANTAAYVRYYAKVPAGGRYIGYERDERGQMHPAAKTKPPPIRQPDGSFVDAPP